MKRYLNRVEKDSCMVIAALHSYMKEFSDRPSAIKTPTVLKYARSASTFAMKTLEALMEPLDVSERAKILEESAKMQVTTQHTREAIRMHKEYEKLNTVTSLDTEDFLQVVEQAVGVCQACKKVGDDAVNCGLRKVFAAQDIQVLDETAPAGKCPYQY